MKYNKTTARCLFFFFCINILITLLNVISFGIFISFPQKRTGVELALKSSGDHVYTGVYTGIQSVWKIYFFLNCLTRGQVSF